MSDIKHCKYCGKELIRPIDMMEHIWQRKEYCNKYCVSSDFNERRRLETTCPITGFSTIDFNTRP